MTRALKAQDQLESSNKLLEKAESRLNSAIEKKDMYEISVASGLLQIARKSLSGCKTNLEDCSKQKRKLLSFQSGQKTETVISIKVYG